MLTPDAHSISQSVWTSGPFPLWDAACHGKRFQKLHESLFQQTKCHHGDKQMSPNVTTVTSRLLHAFCITRDASRALTVFPHRRVSTGNGLQRFPLWKINRQPLAFLKPRVAELIEELIGVNNEGFNPDLEENTAQLDADFYP